MSETDKLTEFIASAKGRGVSDRFIVTLLQQNGWPDRRIFQAFSTYYEGVLGAPVPARGSRIEQARAAFLYLLVFFSLGFWTVALLELADLLIDRAFPSALDLSYRSLSSEAPYQLATLIIAFPLFLWVSRITTNESERRPDYVDDSARNVVTYVALVVASLVLLTTGVIFLSHFLSGDLTTRFAAKAAVLLVLTGGIFWYYLGTVRPEPMPASRTRAFMWAAVAAVCLALVLGFGNFGGPSRQRDVALDERRVSDLHTIAEDFYISSRGQGSRFVLPPTLPARMMDRESLKDPVTGSKYEYIPGPGTNYRLCAVFSTELSSTSNAQWHHKAGHQCFSLDASEDPGISPGTGFMSP